MGHVQTIGNGGDGSKRRASRARAATRAGSEPPRGSLYDEVTARIIAELEEGRFPWVQPWSNAAASPSLFADEDGKTFNLIWSRARTSNGH